MHHRHPSSFVRAFLALQACGLLLGCAGSQTESQAASAPTQGVGAPTPAESVPAGPAEPKTGASAETTPEGPSATARDSADPVDKLTFQAALQAVLDDYALIEALHLEKPGRMPLKIAGKTLPEGMSLYARERAVELVALPDNAATTPVLVFLEAEVSAERGSFKYRYAAEGISGTSRVAPADGKWLLRSSRIHQPTR